MIILYCIIANVITLAILAAVLYYILWRNKDKIGQENLQMFEYLMGFQTSLDKMAAKVDKLIKQQDGKGNND